MDLVVRGCSRLSAYPGRYRRWYRTDNCFGFWKRAAPDGAKVSHEANLTARSNEPNLWRLVTSYHDNGHRLANINPLKDNTDGNSDEYKRLNPDYYALDKSKMYSCDGILFNHTQSHDSLDNIMRYLNTVYCGSMAIETKQINDEHEKEWLLNKFELAVAESLSSDKCVRLGQLLLECQTLDHFLAKKFATLKRYGAEGAEAMMGFFEETFIKASEGGITDVVLCLPHRGRLNLLTSLMKFPPELLFHKIKGASEFTPDSPTTGDVVSHLTSSVDLEMNGSDSRKLHVTMLPNPSHLEAVNPVAMGKARARMLSKRTGPYSNESNSQSKLLCVQVHGDGAISGQGVNMETLAMSQVPHYETGGTVHLVVNNNLGFTTPIELGRSSVYCSDISKLTGCPVIHVNGDHPEEVVKACRVAMDYRLEYDKDIFIVLNCFRRWGHNELDDPSITQPLMYKLIDSRSSVPDIYWEKLKKEGIVDESKNPSNARFEELNKCLKKSEDYISPVSSLQSGWSEMSHPNKSLSTWDTGLPVDVLKFVGGKSVEFPKNFAIHSRLQKSHVQNRLTKLEEGTKLDWSTAEALAVGSLLYQGYNVRISGQDVGRGTFSHRHMMLVDQETDESYIPLNDLPQQSAHLEIANSHLSEEAVLGFEYGYSIENPKHLVIWEAQFGDFFNGAQIMIDTFISSGESKWLLQSGLVMLLPHGYDGAGPEHSSCRIERFLQMCNSSEEGFDGDDVNMHIAHPTTPAQYYHLLRRQMVRNFRKPLVVQSPKVLIRLPDAVSSFSEFTTGSSFRHVIGDTSIDSKQVSKVILCSGKHFYALDSYRRENDIKDTAILRLELLCPFPSGSIHSELKKFPNAKEFIWSQEEPANMGPWSFVEPRFRKQLGIQLKSASRIPYGPPATGIGHVYQREVKQLLTDTFK